MQFFRPCEGRGSIEKRSSLEVGEEKGSIGESSRRVGLEETSLKDGTENRQTRSSCYSNSIVEK